MKVSKIIGLNVGTFPVSVYFLSSKMIFDAGCNKNGLSYFNFNILTN